MSIVSLQGTSKHPVDPFDGAHGRIGEPAVLRDRTRRAERGDADAQFDLGLMYSTGDGVGLYYVAAHQWFNLAAMAGNPEARAMRAEVALDMSPAEIADAQRRAREWLGGHAH